MRVLDLPVFSTLKSAMGYHADRSRTLAANIANADTPGYTPKDLTPFAEVLQSKGASRATSVGPVRTDAAHLSGSPSTASARHAVVRSPDSETTLDGNAVVLEEQMAKVAETRLAYETAIGLYQKTLQFVRTAVRAPTP